MREHRADLIKLTTIGLGVAIAGRKAIHKLDKQPGWSLVLRAPTGWAQRCTGLGKYQGFHCANKGSESS